MGGEGHGAGEDHGDRGEEKEEKSSWQLFKMTTLYSHSSLPLARRCFDLAFVVPDNGQQCGEQQAHIHPTTRRRISLIPTRQQTYRKTGTENAQRTHVERLGPGCDTNNSNRALPPVLQHLSQKPLGSEGAFLAGFGQVWDSSL